ncbi:MAG TPA: patatin-like phospholipase family protein [Longimicrobium sp.]|nr:patatin-like phospholipase family protein [Longimicrobium sp.]
MVRSAPSGRRIGLACAGGVVEGAFYEVGALCALEESVRGLELNRLHVYVGVSAGALVAAALAGGVTARTLCDVVLGRAGGEMDLPPRVLLTPAAGEFARRLGGLPRIVLRALREYAANPADLSLAGALSELQEALPVGLFDSRPLERWLARVLSTAGRTNDFRELETRLRVVAVRLDTSETVVFGAPGADHVPISRAVQASIALPVLYAPVEIDGAWYIDGVARRTLHASAALEAGADLVFCLNPIVPVDLRVGGRVDAGESLVRHGLPAVLSQTLRTMVHSRMSTAFRAYGHTHPDADLVLIEPEVEDPTLFFSNLFSFSNRFRVCEYGYATTRAFLLREAERLDPLLRRHGLELRMDVLRDPARRLAADGRARGGTAGAAGALDRLDRALDRLRAALPADEGG